MKTLLFCVLYLTISCLQTNAAGFSIKNNTGDIKKVEIKADYEVHIISLSPNEMIVISNFSNVEGKVTVDFISKRNAKPDEGHWISYNIAEKDQIAKTFFADPKLIELNFNELKYKFLIKTEIKVFSVSILD